MAGFLSLSRDITEWGWYKDTNTFCVFFHLLMKANWKDGEYMGHKVGRGSLVTGRKQLAFELGLSERNVRTAIDHLKSTNELTIKSTNKFSIITICKYERWVGEETSTDQQNDQQATNNRPTTDQQPTTIEKEKKEKYKEDTIVSKKEKPLWKTSYEEYRRLFEEAKQELLADNEFKTKQDGYYPGIDYEKSIEKNMDYWLTEETWKKVARERVQTIQPKERLKKNFDKNKVYKSFGSKQTDIGYPRSMDDVKNDDINYSWNFYIYWAEKSGAYKLYDSMNGGFPENDQQYQNMLEHTIGGARAFAYVVLVFMRDGWKEYDDERGFMWIYSNYIKANGLYKK